jgi:Tfp pilus assembly protein PilF
MTLNITVVTPRCIYQSADYCLTDLVTREPSKFAYQKIFLKNTFTWSATVCFTGVGRTNNLIVGEWVAERINSIQPDDSFECLLDELMKANEWLSTYPLTDNRHSFSVGAFVGAEPRFVLISNFERLSGLRLPTASLKLSIESMRPIKPTTFVSGQIQAVSKGQRKFLAARAGQDAKPAHMYSILAEVNRRAAGRINSISEACFTTHLHFTGEGGGEEQNVSDRSFVPTCAVIPDLPEGSMQLLDKEFGPKPHHVVGVSFVRAADSEEYYEIQLGEKPNDAETHSNYAHFLQTHKKDFVSAEREYRRALELNPRHAMALNNLGFLFWEQGNKDEAENLFRSALEIDPGHELALLNYASFLLRERADPRASSAVLDSGIEHIPNSGRLLLFRAHLSLTSGSASEALELLRRARENQADQAAVEADYAFALHLSGASVGECIGAYLTAIALNPENGDLRLNLAQLLFIKGNDVEANKQLQEAIRLPLTESAQLEAQFYLLTCIGCDAAEIVRAMKTLLVRGTHLSWDLKPNIESVRSQNPEKADLLEVVRQVISGERDGGLLDDVLARWPSKRI